MEEHVMQTIDVCSCFAVKEIRLLLRKFSFFICVRQGIQLLETCRVQNVAEEKKMNNALLLLYMNASLCALKLGQGARAKRYGRKVRHEQEPFYVNFFFVIHC